MAVLLLPTRYTRQPQHATRISPYWASRGLKFANLPSAGVANLARPGSVLQSSGAFTPGAIQSGRSFDGGYRAEHPAAIDGSKGFTLISVWRARAGQDYFGADNERDLLSTRTVGNQGWTWGRFSAVGGGASGNLTSQTLTFQGVAQYFEPNFTIEAFIDTPVACRYDPVSGKISWFRFGQRSSADTTASPPSAGGTLLFGAQGDYPSNNNPWFDRASATLAFESALTDSEIAALTSSVSSVWQVFQAPPRRLWSASAGGGASYSYTASGGIVLSGAAAKVRGATRTPSGGIQTGGAAPTARGSQRTASGGLALAGAASLTRRAARAAAGGVQLAGAAAVSFFSAVQSRVVVAAGGAIISGAAAIRRSTRKFALGGVLFSGAATVTRTDRTPNANEYFNTIMRISTVYADAGAPSTDINVSGQINGALFLTTIMRASTVNETGNMSAAPINLTGNLL